MSSLSAILSRLSITPSLSETLAPPSTTTNGRSGDSVRRLSTSISAWTSPPMACGSRCATSYTLACLRCTTPNPSLTKTSAREASPSANAPRTASSLDASKDDAVRGAFADELASLADVFVSDGFGVVHRKHASVYDVAQRLPHAIGGLVQAEIEVLKRLTESPERPFVVVLGGAKVSDKLGVIESLLKIADTVLIGGGMSYTFLAAQGYEVGKSLLDADRLDMVKGYLAQAKERGVEIVLPTDVVVATEFSPDAAHKTVPADQIPPDMEGMDIGPVTCETFAAKIAGARTVFWLSLIHI